MLIDYDDNAFNASEAARAFHQLGIELSPEANDLVKRLQTLRANKPEPAPHDAVALLIADSAKDAVIDQAIAFHVGQNHRIQQHARAENILGARILAAILDDRDRLHNQLKAQAEPIIERLHRAADITDNITDLVRAQRTDDAALVATIEPDAESLRQLYFLRDRYTTPPTAQWSTGFWSCQHWQNPWDIEHPAAHDDTLWGTYRSSIRAGGQLWFPTWEQATEASSAHEPSETMLPPFNPVRGSNSAFVG